MKFKIFTLIIVTTIFFTDSTFAQKLKTVKIENKGNSSIEEYQVLESDQAVKHGWYKKYKYKGELQTSGFYNYGQKDSLWVEYYGRQILHQGLYSNDQKNGLWTYYYNNSKNVVAKGHFENGQKTGVWTTYDEKKESFERI